jgi:hypothetical protein
MTALDCSTTIPAHTSTASTASRTIGTMIATVTPVALSGEVTSGARAAIPAVAMSWA